MFTEQQENEDNGDEKESLLPEYLIESWDSSVVLTSMVQFFQTLFKLNQQIFAFF